MEAAQIGCALIFGPDMSNFRDIAAQLTAEGAATWVTDADGLAGAVRKLLAEGPERTAMIDAGHRVIGRHKDSLDQTLTHLVPFLERALS